MNKWFFILALSFVSLVSAQPDQFEYDDERPREQAENKVTIKVKGNFRYITSNGIPDHDHGAFPNSGNPHAIQSQSYTYKVPLYPKKKRHLTEYDRQPFGVALNGVPFDPGTAEYWNEDRSSGWRYEALSGKINFGLDESNAHVQLNGAYHYHGIPTELMNNLREIGKMILVGYAADGFPIYAKYGTKEPIDDQGRLISIKSSYLLKEGDRPYGPDGSYDGTFVEDYEFVDGAGDLDECNGRYGLTPEYPDGIYHYYLTENFPFVPRCFVGTPHPSFAKKGGGKKKPPSHLRLH